MAFVTVDLPEAERIARWEDHTTRALNISSRTPASRVKATRSST